MLDPVPSEAASHGENDEVSVRGRVFSRFAGTVFALAVVAGCTVILPGSTGAEEPPAATNSALEMADEPGPDAVSSQETTPEQWASLVAPFVRDYASIEFNWSTGLLGGECLFGWELEALACDAAALDMAGLGRELTETLEQALDESSATYLGVPPRTLADLVEKTRLTAKSLTPLYDKIECPGKDCFLTSNPFETQWKELGDTFAAWSPYL